MRRGYTLIELLTSMTILTVVLGLMLPLLFMGDRALAGSTGGVSRSATAARLLADVSRDLRQYPVAHTRGGAVVVGAARYRYDAAAGQTTRDDGLTLTSYPGVRVALQDAGSLRRVHVSGEGLSLTADVWCRNR